MGLEALTELVGTDIDAATPIQKVRSNVALRNLYDVADSRRVSRTGDRSGHVNVERRRDLVEAPLNDRLLDTGSGQYTRKTGQLPTTGLLGPDNHQTAIGIPEGAELLGKLSLVGQLALEL